MTEQATAAVRRGRPPGDHAAKRADLLNAATTVIAEEGYARTSLSRIAKRADCTTGAVTYYFANKEELVCALTQDWFDQYDAVLDKLSRGHTDLRATLKEWLTDTTADPRFWPVLTQLLSAARSEPALAALIATRYARYRRMFTETLANEQAAGRVRDDIAADVLADQLAAMGDGWVMMFPIEPQRFTPDRVRSLLDAVMALVAPRSE